MKMHCRVDFALSMQPTKKPPLVLRRFFFWRNPVPPLNEIFLVGVISACALVLLGFAAGVATMAFIVTAPFVTKAKK